MMIYFCVYDEKKSFLYLKMVKQLLSQEESLYVSIDSWRQESVLSAAKGLLEKDFITQDKDIYTTFDLFFDERLRMKGFNKDIL